MNAKKRQRAARPVGSVVAGLVILVACIVMSRTAGAQECPSAGIAFSQTSAEYIGIRGLPSNLTVVAGTTYSLSARIEFESGQACTLTAADGPPAGVPPQQKASALTWSADNGSFAGDVYTPVSTVGGTDTIHVNFCNEASTWYDYSDCITNPPVVVTVVAAGGAAPGASLPPVAPPTLVSCPGGDLFTVTVVNSLSQQVSVRGYSLQNPGGATPSSDFAFPLTLSSGSQSTGHVCIQYLTGTPSDDRDMHIRFVGVAASNTVTSQKLMLDAFAGVTSGNSAFASSVPAAPPWAVVAMLALLGGIGVYPRRPKHLLQG
jgi:hypothetical protein